MRERLQQGMAQLGLTASEAQLDSLLHYLALLTKWNKVYNLTAIIDPKQMVTHHLLDSLAILSYLAGRRIIDVGCGAGLPGIPLAIMAPDRQFVLLDSNNKKTRFVTQAVIELKLKNVTVQNSRVERYQPEALFDTVVSRAFASLRDMLQWCGPLCTKQGIFLAMKGVSPQDELAELPGQYQVVADHSITVPGLDAERHAVILRAKPAH